MKKFLLLSFMLMFTFAFSETWAQERTISGKVTAVEDGTALPGVNVVLKGTSSGTVTDIDGNYTLSVPSDGGTLVFSFIGLSTEEIEIGTRSVVDLSMSPDVQQLSEVVVTAIGIEREKKALGYAVSDVSGDLLAQKSEPDPVRSLQGKVPGVNIISSGGAAGGGTNINIRGQSSLLGNNQPLFVVDGVPFDNSTNPVGDFTQAGGSAASSRSFDIDPNNIESMTVLKGAAASALYGSRASNGVIVITTKSGKSQSSRKGLEVSFNSSYNVVQVANLPDRQKRYTQGNNFLYVDGNFGTWGAPFDLDNPAWDVPNNANLIRSIDPATGLAWVNHPYDRYDDPTGTPFFPELVGDSILLRSYDVEDDYLEDGYLFETSVSIAGGGENSNFTATLSRTFEEGFTPGNEVERISAAIGGNITLDNGLFIGGNFNYVNTDLEIPPTAGLITGGVSVYERLLYLPPNIDLTGWPIEDSNGNSAFYRPDNDNPFYLSEYAPQGSKVNRFYGRLNFGYDITDWLNVGYQIGANYFMDERENVIPVSSFGGSIGELTLDFLSNLEVDANFIATISKDINEDIGFRGILGHNWNYRNRERERFTASGQIIRNLNNLTNYELFQGDLDNLNERSYQGVYADLSFDYKDYLFLTLTGRNDWTSTLPEDERSYFYGGVSSSFIFTDAFNLSSNILSYGKVRASFARTGNDIDAYLTQPILFATNLSTGGTNDVDFPFNGANAQTTNNRLGNDELTPEFTTEWEFGTELQFFQNRIGLDLTYYTRSTTDQIVPIDLARSTGFADKIVNIGEVTNKGFEIGLNAVPIQNNDFRWDLYGTFTRNVNTVEELTEGLTEVGVGGFTDLGIRHFEGEEFGQIYGSVAARSDDGQLLIDPSTGKLLDGGLAAIGNPNPDFQTSIMSTFSWKGISLYFLLDYRHGGEMYSATYNQLYGRGVTEGTVPDGPRGREITVVIPGVVGDPTTNSAVLDDSGNTITNGTQLTVNDWYFINTFGSAGYDEFSVFDASTIRLREISLGYDLPKSLLEKTPFGSANITFIGRNLWYDAVNFPDDLNFDPETSGVGVGNAQGIDFGVVPTTKRYGVNLRLTF
ncbi:MAG: SusC/RagA family TonB-linked outer membrane protein [Bacteroidota bacterium]